MSELLKNEPVKRVQVALSEFNKGINIKVRKNSVSTVLPKGSI